MRKALLPLLLLTCFSACRDKTTPVPDAASTITPMGLPSAVTFVPSANAVEVLTTLHHPTELVLGEDALFVLDAEEVGQAADNVQDVVSIPLARGGSPKTLFAAQQGAMGLALASGRLVWTVSEAKLMAAKVGAQPAAIAKTYALDDASTASDGTDVFTFGERLASGKADVVRVSPAGKTMRVAPVGLHASRSAIATNAASVFWMQDDALVRAPKEGGDVVVVAKLSASKVERLVADESAVYWTDLGRGDPTWSGRVYQASLATGAITPISDAPIPRGIAIDGDTVYWTSTGDGRILARKKSGGATIVLARDQHAPVGLAVDAKYVYWTNQTDGTVCRADKTPHGQP